MTTKRLPIATHVAATERDPLCIYGIGSDATEAMEDAESETKIDCGDLDMEDMTEAAYLRVKAHGYDCGATDEKNGVTYAHGMWMTTAEFAAI